MKRLRLIFLCCFLAVPAQGEQSPLLRELIFRLQSSKPKATALTTDDRTCQSAYQKLMDKPTLDVRMVFGYKDARPARFVSDHHERVAFVDALVSPCVPGFFACGFRRSDDDGNLFLKTIAGFNGKSIDVRLQVLNSSVGSDDLENRKDPFQGWQTRWTEQVFLNGFVEADVVFYNGHSRVGGGPDFSPPRLMAGESNEVDYYFYKTNRPGFTKILRKLQKATTNKVQMVGLFSCASSQHFSQDIFKQRPQAGLISSTNLLYFADALENSLAALSSVLEMRCQKDFQIALRYQSPRQGSQIEGFFKK